MRDGWADLLTIASSFRRADFPTALAEFRRVLRRDGWFVALWNTRYPDRCSLLLEIEAELRRIVPDLRRVSSGVSAFADRLTTCLMDAKGWSNPVYAERFQIEKMARERYLGVWRSVYDVQVQAEPKSFEQFTSLIWGLLIDIPALDCLHRTRRWIVRRE